MPSETWNDYLYVISSSFMAIIIENMYLAFYILMKCQPDMNINFLIRYFKYAALGVKCDKIDFLRNLWLYFD